MTSPNFPSLLQAFFLERLLEQRQASPNTISGYRDTFRLLIRFAMKRLGKTTTELRLEDLDAAFVVEFLQHLECDRQNSPRTRNLRLAAIRSFTRYVELNEPAHAHHCQRILAIPAKRYERGPVDFLSTAEVDALLNVPDPATRIGRRDRTLLLVACQTGLRVSELCGLRCQDVDLNTGAHVRCVGKGRKQRCTPLRKETIAMLRAWLRELNGAPDSPLFPSIAGNRISRDAIERLVRKHTATASAHCPSLKSKRVTPHVLRHTAAMGLLQNGVDRSVIALWLGHESVTTTQMYIHADTEVKARALARTTPANVRPGRFRADSGLLAFLDGL